MSEEDIENRDTTNDATYESCGFFLGSKLPLALANTAWEIMSAALSAAPISAVVFLVATGTKKTVYVEVFVELSGAEEPR